MQSACLDCKNPTLIFEEVLEPFQELCDFRARQRADRLLDLLNIASHRSKYGRVPRDLQCRRQRRATELPGQGRAQTEFGNEGLGAREKRNYAWDTAGPIE
jgi:hypothetical protein